MRGATMRFDTSKFEKFALSLGADVQYQSVEFVGQQVNDLKQASLAEVPTVTGALAGSIYTEVAAGVHGATGEVGYGGRGNVNPVTGAPVDSYIMGVHEDLDASHPNGKAKFLEDPARKLAEQYDEKVAITLFKAIDKYQGG